MAELSSPLQVMGLLETNCSSDPGIYSIYSYKTENMGGNESIGFAIFYSSDDDMDNTELHDVKLLWEKGKITSYGEDFLKEEWGLFDRSEYRNNKGDKIRIMYSPIGKDGKVIPLPDTGQNKKQEEKQAYPKAPQIDNDKETVTDIDGNTYHTITIGKQVWMVENLKTTKYNDGTPIKCGEEEDYFEKEIHTIKLLGIFSIKKNKKIAKKRSLDKMQDHEWRNLREGAFCWYGNNIENKEKFGALYNWQAVHTGKLAPKGWHIPTEKDWGALENYLIKNGYNPDNTRNENKIAKALSAKTDWEISTDAETVGNEPSENNRSGFSALPGGYRNYYGGFEKFSSKGLWWSATENNSGLAWNREINSHSSKLVTDYNFKVSGLSVRCIKD